MASTAKCLRYKGSALTVTGHSSDRETWLLISWKSQFWSYRSWNRRWVSSTFTCKPSRECTISHFDLLSRGQEQEIFPGKFKAPGKTRESQDGVFTDKKSRQTFLIKQTDTEEEEEEEGEEGGRAPNRRAKARPPLRWSKGTKKQSEEPQTQKKSSARRRKESQVGAKEEDRKGK